MRTNVRDVLNLNKGIGPGFHLLRHVLAIGIVLFHCRQAIWWTDSALVLRAAGRINTGVAHPSTFTFEDIIRPASHSLVGLFFALSGFLVAGSALRTKNTGRFLTNRGLRIFPALGVETMLSAFVLGPVVTIMSLRLYFTNSEFFGYLGNLIGWMHFTLPGVFITNPLPRTVNGQLWTLPSEFWCYFIMAILMATGLIAKRNILLAAGLVSITVACVLFIYDPVTYNAKAQNFFAPWYIVMLFWFGVLFFLYADRITLRLEIFVLCIIGYWAIIFFDVITPLAGFPLGYMMVYIGMTAFPWWDKAIKSDYSYGIYLYHFPLIQTLMWYLKPTLFVGKSHIIQLVVLFPVSLVISIGFAALSWRFIEKPALALRKVFAPTESVTGKVPSTVASHDGFVVTPEQEAADAATLRVTCSPFPGR